MADSERTRADEGAGGKSPKRGEELDQLLQRIAAHIAEVEKHGTATPVAPARVEMVKASPAAGGAPRSEPMPAAVTGEEGNRGPVTDGTKDDAADAPSPSLRRTPQVAEPPALRSALSNARAATAESSLLRRGRADDAATAAEEVASVLPPADLAGAPDAAAQSPVEPISEEPWDQDTAEALTKSYEAEAAVPPLRSLLDVMGGTPKGAPGERRAGDRRLGSPERTAPASGAEADADGGPDRLLAAARRVERMLDRLAPREAVDALGERFATLENAVGRTGDQLKRLDGIETRLEDLGAKLTDEQVMALFGSLVPTAEELTQFAEEAAGRAAERVLEAHAQEMSAQPTAAAGASAALGPDIKALNQVLAAFMDERRRNDAGTQEALETLQLAMQHLLDRIDPAEGTAGIEREPASSRRTPAPPSAALNAYDPQFDAPDRMPGSIGVAEPAGPVPELRYASEDRLPHREPVHAARGSGEPPPSRGVHPLEMPAAFHEAGSRDDTSGLEGPPLATASPAPHAREPAAPISDRQAFIAMARKAAEKAKAEADRAADAATEKAGKRRGKQDNPAKAGGLAGRLTTGVRPGVLIVALGAMLLAGVWFLVGPRLGLPRGIPPVAERQAPPPAAARPEKGAQPDVESDETSPAPAPAERAPPQPKKTSDEIPAPPNEDRQEANAILPPAETAGPGIAVALSETPATIGQVMQARERARLADLSQRTAFAAARSHQVPNGASPVETASIAPAQAPAAKAPHADRADETRQLVLPPAASGPLSLRLAASQGDASAQLEIATRLAEGRGVKQNFPEAAAWYERAAAQGEAVAQYRLATLLERGMGLKADRARARALYEQAAEQGNLKAMHNLAVMSAHAAQGAPDYASAAALFSRAASHGLADSQYNLGILYESGLGVPKDHAAAYKWYALAARAGDQDAGRRRDMLIARLPAETIQAMEAQLATWRAAVANERANNARVAGEAWKQRSAETRR